MDLGFGSRRSGLEEVEVAALVGLGDVLQEQRPVSARVLRRWRLPFRAAFGEFVVADVEGEPAGGDVEFDDVAVLDKGEWAADRGLRGDVEYAGTVAGAAHPGVGDPYHVADTVLEKLLRNR